VTYGRMVRDLAAGAGFPAESDGPHVRRYGGVHNDTWISSLGRTLSERRDYRVCLGIDRLTKTPLDDVEL
jgi:hypothetical protein